VPSNANLQIEDLYLIGVITMKWHLLHRLAHISTSEDSPVLIGPNTVKHLE
jgi:hypothetical protein